MIIEIEVAQGSPEWHQSRIGLVSGSRFKDILTEPRGKADKEAGRLSDTANSYMLELAAMILTDQAPEIKGAALDWGHENEPVAKADYELMFDVDVVETGIFVMENRKIGASPDGLVGDDGMIEIKCPYNSVNHLKTIISGEIPKEHTPQVQGNMWINGRQWCDFISFDPRIDGSARLFVQRIERDDAYINNVLAPKVLAFTEKLTALLADKFGIKWQGVTVPEIK